MATPHLIRLTVGLDRRNMPRFLPGSKLIQSKLAASTSIFPALPVSPATLLTQIGDVESVQLQTKTNKGLIALRKTKVDALWTSLESDCTYCEGLCQQNPEQGLAWASASGFHLVGVGEHLRDVISIKVDLGKGIAHLDANKAMLPAPSGKKSAAVVYLWRHTVDGGKTIVNDEPTSTHVTTITALPLGVEVGFGVARKDAKGIGPWSQWFTAFIR
jgi:hypothetical protein